MEMSGNGHRIGMAYTAVKLKRILQVLHLDHVKCIVEDVSTMMSATAVCLGNDTIMGLMITVQVKALDWPCLRV